MALELLQENVALCPSRILLLEKLADTVGGASVFTVTVKLLLADFEPSETVTVIVAEPERPLAGVTLTVRLAPLPPRLIPLTGTNVVLLEVRERASDPAAVSSSPTEKEILPVEPF